MQWHRDDDVIAVIYRERAIQKTGEPANQRSHSGVFEQVDQATESAFVKSEAQSAVKTSQTRAAKRTDAVSIERKGILKWGVAGAAEVIGFERRGRIQARLAHRNPGKTIQRRVANAAFCGEKKRKNSVGDRAEAEGGRSR